MDSKLENHTQYSGSKNGYLESYFKNLNKNLNNKSFLKDEFFIDLKKELNFHIK